MRLGNDDFDTTVISMHLNPQWTFHAEALTVFHVDFIHDRPEEFFAAFPVHPQLIPVKAALFNICISHKEFYRGLINTFYPH